MSRKFNAMLGLGALAAFGFASSAFAQCPSSPVPPWAAAAAVGGGALNITTGGYDGTSCKLSASLGTSAATLAVVRDDTPADEPRYRAQFLVNPDELGAMAATHAVTIFTANSSNSYPAVNPTTQMVRINMVGSSGGNKFINIVAACDNGGSNVCSQTVTTPLATGVNRIEIDLQKGATGSVRVWLNNTTEGSPDATVAVNNDGWSGVSQAFLGLGAASALFRSVHTGKLVHFDEFDSRRQTFIGN